MHRLLRPSLCLLAASSMLSMGCQTHQEQSAALTPTPSLGYQPSASRPLGPFAGAVGAGVTHAQQRVDELVEACGELLEAIEGQNLALAQRAYYDARAPYEEVEVIARQFPELHLNIDGRPHHFSAGELDTDFRGFHRIEIFLFSRQRTQPALKYAKYLVEDVENLQAMLTDREQFGAATLFSAMISRATEIATLTITSEEELWSDQTLLAIKHGWIGIHSQYRPFGAKVRARNAQLAERIDRAYRRAVELIAADFPMGQTAGSPFSLVSHSRRREIADASMKLRMYLDNAAETLSLDVSMN